MQDRLTDQIEIISLRLLAIALTIVVVGLVGHMSYQDQILEEKEYCENVSAKVWPDYNENFENICKKDVDS